MDAAASRSSSNCMALSQAKALAQAFSRPLRWIKPTSRLPPRCFAPHPQAAARLLCMVCRSSEALCHCPSFPQALMATDRWNLEAPGLSNPGPGGLIELDALGQQLILWPSDARSCGRGASKGNTWGAGRRRSCSVNRRGSQPRSIQTHGAAPDSCGTRARRRTSLFRSVRPCARGFAPHSACR